jgi:serine/threonine protein kinase
MVSWISVPLIIVASVLGLGLLIYLIVRLFQVIVRLVTHVFGTLGRMIADIFRLVGAVIVAVVFLPLILANIVIARWSAAAHYGRAFTDECMIAKGCVYRVLIGHPLRLFGLAGLVEGLEKRLPQAIAEAPGPDRPSKRQGMFEGFAIVGSLPSGGSGGKLYIAEPDELKRAAFEKRGHGGVDRVVIKTFSLGDGSSLPQIVRESRALDAAKKMGLVLEHELTDDRFFYVMRYVPGDSLTIATQRLHAMGDGGGLDGRGLRLAMGYGADLLESLDAYHRGGLWHKDVKPDNLIVDQTPDPVLGRGRAHLVDFGLLTPLRGSMTLTTHGTEYFRDPELVRQALRGVKVHQIDGARFDVYAAGAVLYAMIENSFPAHGGLSQITKRCPEALRWIVRRAMTEYDKRYASALAMLEDLRVVASAQDPFAVKPADLPSMRGTPASEAVDPELDESPSVWVGRLVQFINPRTGHKKSNVVDQHGRVWVNYKQHPVVTFEGAPCVVWKTEPEVGPCVLDDMRIVQHNGKWLLVGQVVEKIDSGPGRRAIPSDESQHQVVYAAASPVPPRAGPESSASPASRTPPKLRIADWWTGRYEVADRGAPAPRDAHGFVAQADFGFEPRAPRPPRAEGARPAARVTPRESRASAAEQLASARRRVAERRSRAARGPMRGARPGAGPTDLRGRRRPAPAGINAGVAVAATMAVLVGFGAIAMMMLNSREADPVGEVMSRVFEPAGVPAPPEAPTAPAPPSVAATAPAWSGLVPPAGRELDGLGLVLVWDFRPPFEESTRVRLDKAAEALASAGVRLVSNVHPGVGESDSHERIARYIALRGASTLDCTLGERFAEALREDEGADAVWWFAPGDRPGERRCLLVSESACNAFVRADVWPDDLARFLIEAGLEAATAGEGTGG